MKTITLSLASTENRRRALGIKLATGANALDTAKAIKAKLAELQPFFPQGMKVLYPYDTTPFVQLSIHEVVKNAVRSYYAGVPW